MHNYGLYFKSKFALELRSLSHLALFCRQFLQCKRRRGRPLTLKPARCCYAASVAGFAHYYPAPDALFGNAFKSSYVCACI